MNSLIPLPEWTILMGFVFGAFIGSFLNVVIYRMPHGIPLGKPSRSFCPKCKHSLGMMDLIPLLSWLIAGRRCRYCKQSVTSRYFWIEFFNGLIWMGIWYSYLLGQTPDLGRAIAYALGGSAFLVAIATDLEFFMIPEQINAFLLFVGLGYNVWLYIQKSPLATTWGIPSSIAGALTGVGVLWGIAFLGRVAFRKDAMGHGDIKMARGIGAILFPGLAGISFGLAVVFGAVFGIVQILLRKKAEGRPSPPAPSPISREVDSSAPGGSPREETGEGGEEYPPESIGSLLKCGLGYTLAIDVVLLFKPSTYQKYFGEHPFEPLEDLETFEPEATMIPFGPYLALGAILAVIFEKQLTGAVNAYLQNMGPSPAFFWNTF